MLASGSSAAGNEPGGIGAFEYRFDAKDTDLSRAGEGTKEVSHTETDPVTGQPVKVIDVPATTFDKVNKTADDTIAAVQWLDDTFSADAYAIVNHPSRAQLWHVGDFRAMNDAAPTIAFGMEGLPGHQPDAHRQRAATTTRSADPAVQATARTYGGADWMIRQVGGLWDSLLGEGRDWWIFNNSDFHNFQTKYKDAAGNYYATRYYDFWPGQYAKTWTYVDQFTNERPRGRHALRQRLRGRRRPHQRAQLHGRRRQAQRDHGPDAVDDRRQDRHSDDRREVAEDERER